MSALHRRWLAGPLTLLVLLLTGCSPDEADPPPPVRPVLSAIVQPKVADLFGPFAATIAARTQSDLGFRIAGRIVARDVSVGDVVRAGQRLAALDPTVTQFALDQARADLANAKAQAVNAAATAARQEALFASNAVSKSQLDTAVAARDTAAARVTEAEAALKKAQDQLGYSALDADFAGVVTAWSAEVGQVVAAGQAVVTVARPDVIEAVVDIPDAQIAAVTPGEAFAVQLQSAPDIVTTGRVREIAPQSDAATRSRRIRLSLDDPPSAFRLGTTVAVSQSRPIKPQVELPATTLLERQGESLVWVVAPDGRAVHSRKVTVGARRAGMVTILSGLVAGEAVVTAGVHSLAEDQPIRPEKPL